MSTYDIPVVSFFKRMLDPFLIWGSLILISWVYREAFTGYYLVLMIITFFVSSYVFEQTGIHRSWRNGKLLKYIVDTLLGWGLVVGILIFLGFATKLAYRYSEEVIYTWFLITPLVLILSHMVVQKIASDVRKKGEVRPVVIVGANEMGLNIANRIREFPYLLMEVKGFFEDRNESRSPIPASSILGGVADVAAYVRKHNIQMIFISLPMAAQPRIRALLDDLHDTTASIYFLPDVYLFDLMQARFDHVGDIPVIGICESPFMGVDNVVKLASDFAFSLIALFLFSPLMLLIAIAVKATSPGPVIFKQRRYGLNGEEIIVYKFRSMTVSEDGDKVDQAKRNDPRITRIGAFLRKSSLDELPQFINVLQGRMSIVGPRPHAVAHNELYRKLIKGYMLRHKVKPGITGWAQVNGLRGETEALEKMQARIAYDLEYLQNWSLWFDTLIIFRTIWVVLHKDNAY